MTLEENITAILDTYFCGFRAELIEACAKRITEQVERQADTPQTDLSAEEFVEGMKNLKMEVKRTDCGWK